jgi:hypothetical protein
MPRKARVPAGRRDNQPSGNDAVVPGDPSSTDCSSTHRPAPALDELRDTFSDFGRRSFDDAVTDLLVGGMDDSVAVALWRERLSHYVAQQGPLDALRLRSSSEPPWPATDNPMVGYLIDRGREIATQEGLEEALASLAANAWFEGVIAERVRMARLIDQD